MGSGYITDYKTNTNTIGPSHAAVDTKRQIDSSNPRLFEWRPQYKDQLLLFVMNSTLVTWWWINDAFWQIYDVWHNFAKEQHNFWKMYVAIFDISRILCLQLCRDKAEGGWAHVKSRSWRIIDAVIIATRGDQVCASWDSNDILPSATT